MLSQTEERLLGTIEDHLSREDPELARWLSPFHPRKPGWTWLSWVLVYVMVAPVALIMLLLEPVVGAVVLIAPAVIGVLARGRRLCRRCRPSGT